MNAPELTGAVPSRSAVEQLEAALAMRQEIVQELHCLAHRRGERTRQHAKTLKAQLVLLAQELERLLAEIEQVAGPPAGSRLDAQEAGDSGLMAG
ncbi:MAG TPA: hypothetical protein VGW38_22875 [Chloroflexota bacterium]|nr:hypothetical protein [Chloroflexota bacterium]